PAVRLEGQGQAPGYPDQVLGLEPVHRVRPGSLRGVVAGVAEVEPEHPGGLEHAAGLLKDLDHVGHEQLRRRLQPVALDGEPVLIDAGVGTYTRQTFSPRRYEIWTMQSAY